MKMLYNYVIVGAGLYGATCARILTDHGLRCLVVERRDTVGGNCHTEWQDNVLVHKYGAHIFHTNSDEVWSFVTRFAQFKRYNHAPIANYRGKIFNLPFNMNTFAQMWGVVLPSEARKIIQGQIRQCEGEAPKTLEEYALNIVGKDIYEYLIKGYTEKQWGRSCDKLPPEILGRLPIRFVYDNSYFEAKYQAIPVGGYTLMIQQMLRDIDVVTGVDYLANRAVFDKMAERTIFTGAIDEYFDYSQGTLEWRSLKFEHETLDTQDYQGVAVMNFTDAETPYTRIIEHRHFDDDCVSDKTVITKEYPVTWEQHSQEKYYPIESARNKETMCKYRELSEKDKRTVFGGRLAEYKYIDMDETVLRAMKKAKLLCSITPF